MENVVPLPSPIQIRGVRRIRRPKCVELAWLYRRRAAEPIGLRSAKPSRVTYVDALKGEQFPPDSSPSIHFAFLQSPPCPVTMEPCKNGETESETHDSVQFFGAATSGIENERVVEVQGGPEVSGKRRQATYKLATEVLVRKSAAPRHASESLSNLNAFSE